MEASWVTWRESLGFALLYAFLGFGLGFWLRRAWDMRNIKRLVDEIEEFVNDET